MRLSIDTKEMAALGLTLQEMWVLQTLRVLSHNKPWKGSYSELARICKCGKRMTIQRTVSKLISLGLVADCIGGWDAQNEQKTAQNEQSGAQNEQKTAQNVKRKEPKENINNNYIKSECENNNIYAPAPAKKFFVNNNFTPPTWEEWRDFGNSKEIPYATFRKAWAYYTMRGWKDVADWKAALYYWDLSDRR
ncbi:MAG: helix-turn-helix domain-containing protein [Paludibacteraceae bacterium]|nr:helix-turn-helix domain-containing protein [Paludibacteraceae bacterium]